MVALAKVLQSISDGRFDPTAPGNPSAWVSIVALHVALDHWRRNDQHAQMHKAADDVPDEGGIGSVDPESSLERRRGAEFVKALLKELDEKARAIIVLRYWDDLTQEEIASALEIPVGTVKSRLSRAEQSLRDAARRAKLRDEVF